MALDPLPKCHLCGTDIAIGAPRAAIGNSRDWAHYECFYPKEPQGPMPNVSGDPGSTANTTLPGGAQPRSERIKLARNIMLALYDGQTDQAAMMLLALLDGA